MMVVRWLVHEMRSPFGAISKATRGCRRVEDWRWQILDANPKPGGPENQHNEEGVGVAKSVRQRMYEEVERSKEGRA